MSDLFATFDPASWMEDDVFVVRLTRSVRRRVQRMASSWRSSVMIGAAGLALATAPVQLDLQFTGSENEVLLARERIPDDQTFARGGPSGDVVPNGYWRELSAVASAMPELTEAPIDDEYEPFI